MTNAPASSPVWDCHVHVIGDRDIWPLAASRTYDPPFAPAEALQAHLDAIGGASAVVVQPSVYGFDNGCLLDALTGSGDRWRGVVVPAPGTSQAELEEMHAVGVRGVRCNHLNTGGLSLADCSPWWPWMEKRGWHVQVQVDASTSDMPALLDQIPVPIVVDHMGFPSGGLDADGLGPLIDAVHDGRAFVKLSAPYRISRQPVPHGDALALAAKFLAANASFCLWASDWPHTDFFAPRQSDDDWLSAIQTAAGTAWGDMCGTAQRLYI